MPGAAAAPGAGAVAAVMSREEFRAFLEGVFTVASAASRLQSLGVKGDPTFPPAADAIYDTAAEVPALRWLIEQQGVWLQRVIALAVFGGAKVAAVRAEIAMMKLQARSGGAAPPEGFTIEGGKAA